MSRSFDRWLDTYIEEKGIDPFEIFEVQPGETVHIMPYAAVIATAKIASEYEQRAIRRTLVVLDFNNLDPRHYLRWLGEGMAKKTDEAMTGATI
jgi:hypothetical protein